jgi:hypothetical protein
VVKLPFIRNKISNIILLYFAVQKIRNSGKSCLSLEKRKKNETLSQSILPE